MESRCTKVIKIAVLLLGLASAVVAPPGSPSDPPASVTSAGAAPAVAPIIALPPIAPGTDKLVQPPIKASVGNIIYSVIGYLLGGALVFVSLFDPIRKPIINYFDGVFGNKTARRRRETGSYIEQNVGHFYDTLCNAMDKVATIQKIRPNWE